MLSHAESLILIVDDTITNAKILFDVLQEAGFRVLVAKTGESALEKLQEVTPDLILLDIMMPGIDGFETCRRLKSNPDTRDIPVIFMTALSDEVDKVKGLMLGAVDYLTKPIQQEEVLARINLHLQLRNLNKSLEQRVAERTAELTAALEKLEQSQLQLVQNEKMSALGQLIAGVAHEINNPVGFLKGNLKYARMYTTGLLDHLRLYQEGASADDLVEHAAAIDLDYLLSDLPKSLASMQAGIDRLLDISASLRTFSRSDTAYKVQFDLHDGIESTLLILKHRLKANHEHPTIEVLKDYGDLPEIECFPGQLNQVFTNLIANAIDALEEAMRNPDWRRTPMIQIRTELLPDQSHIAIHVKDNGMGMSEEVRRRIFDHLFTTKPVGKGTGLGLSIARQIIVEKHDGTLKVESVPGEGSEFVITLPVHERTPSL